MEKKALPHEDLVQILELLQEGDFEREDTTSLDDTHQEMISVEDYGDGVSIRAYYDEDGPRHSIERPVLIYTYSVGEYTLVAEQGDDDIILSLDSKDYTLDTSDEAYEALEEWVSEDVGSFDEYDAFESVAWAEWTEEELYDEIISELSYDTYICVDGEYLGEYDEDDYPDEETYTAEEVARDLASNGCPDPW